ncbi:uncharacterized protein [Diabrotica undecimpunctata]|uniref:uncharacterized protein n=1 Tax=Diabrotica undecimpunctata TaxID=50387 RepID=UPI003B63BABF
MATINPKHLKTDELTYELLIRDLEVPSTVDEKRRVLSGILSQEASDRSFSETVVPLEFEQDHNQALATLADLSSIIDEFSGSKSDYRYKCICSRLTHLSGRVSRLKTTSSTQETLKRQLRSKLLSIEGVLVEKLNLPSESTPVRVEPHTASSVVKSVPIYKWGIQKFSGKQPLIPFLEQIETLKISRNCSNDDLFLSAGDLFDGNAFTWWHNHLLKKTFQSWSDLVAALKETYLPSDYERNLWEQIRSTRQSFREPVSTFISNFEALFFRLPSVVSEKDKVSEIRRGLLPDYIKALALHDIDTVSDLTSYCTLPQMFKKRSARLFDSGQESTSLQSNVCIKPKREEHTRKKFEENFKQRTSRVTFQLPPIVKTRAETSDYNCDFNPLPIDKTPIDTTHNVSLNPANISFPLISTSDTLCRTNPLLDIRTQDNRPYISINIGSETISALVDSGSNVSIIGSPALFLLKKLNLHLHYDISVQLTTADGNVQSTLGYVFLPVTLSGSTQKLKVLVVPSISHKMILGMDFMKLFRISLDFTNFSYSTAKLSTCVVNTIVSSENLSTHQLSQLHAVVKLFKEIGPTDSIGRTHLYTHHIDTGDAKPIRQRQYPLSPAMQKIFNEGVDEMLKLKVIEPLTTSTPWLSPLWLVPKKDSSYRVCFDGRKLNSITVPDSYPMPLIDSIISKVRDAKFISSIDLKQAFYQIPLDDQSKLKTAFTVQNRGLFCFNVLPFGLNNSAQAMCRVMDSVIGPLLEPYVFYYLDDIIVVTPDFDCHIKILKMLFKRLKYANLTVNFEKCQFCRPSLKFLGFVVDQQGLRTDPAKVEAILEYPVPKTTTQIRRLIGLIGYYRRFLNNFASICTPISDLLKGKKKGQSIVWTPEANLAFSQIKQALTSAPVLASPDFDKHFYLACDASDTGVGGVLFQKEDGLEHPIAFFSKTLSKAQRKYTTTEKELLAILLSIEKFRCYIEGSENFTVITDHSSLQWLYSMKNPSPRIARWIMKLSCHKFTVIHRSGSLNVVADSLSRIPEQNPEISLLDLSNLKTDTWYDNMVQKVQNNPDQFPAFKVHGKVLYKHIFSRNKFSDPSPEWKIFVPSPHRKDILKLFHGDPTAAHLGVYKTLSRITELYYWPRMRLYVANYINWDKEIFKIAQAIRLAKHEVTQFSPSFLTFARNIPLDGSFFGAIEDKASNVININNKLFDPRPLENMSSIFKEVQKRIRHSYATNSSRYNLRRRDVKYHVGDKVWKKNFVLSKAVDDFSAKLAPKFVPCIVNKVLSKLVYNLKDLDGNDLGNFHVRDIKLDVTDSSDDENQ